jgi:hypothetical protein
MKNYCITSEETQGRSDQRIPAGGAQVCNIEQLRISDCEANSVLLSLVPPPGPPGV